MKKLLTKKSLTCNLLICLAILFSAITLSVFVGSEKISIGKVFHSLFNSPHSIDYQIFIVRLHRVILCIIIGSALAASGVTLQAILRNPLADPYILGVSSGAGLGAIAAMVLGFQFSAYAGSITSAFAFAGAMVAVAIVWYIGSLAGRNNTTSLLLAGVIVNAFFSAIIMLLTAIAKNEQLRSIVSWLMGNIVEKGNFELIFGATVVLCGLAGLLFTSYKLNALSLGDYQAKSLGVNASLLRAISFALAAVITAVAVSFGGLIGFVGLVVPHAVRLIFGPDHRLLLPASAILGAAFLLTADTVSRSLFTNEMFPVGVITAIAGAPIFLFLLIKYSKKVNWV